MSIDLTFVPHTNFMQRMLVGVGQHFQKRAAGWFLGVAMVCFATLLWKHPEMLDRPFYGHLARLGSSGQLVVLCYAIGITRLIALFVNGSFRGLKITPYLRAATAVASALIWLQFALAAVIDIHPSIGMIIYPMLTVFDCYNTGSAAMDIGKPNEE